MKIFESLDSTSDLCIARAKAGEAAGLAVLAHTQTAGRGSRGRSWSAPAGNLNLSVMLRPLLPVAATGVFPLLAGIAVAEAARHFLPAAARLMLKWPNDVLLGGAKFAGILIDAAPTVDRMDWLVIGIGMNLRAAPQIPGRATTTLAAQGAAITAPDAANVVLERLSEWLAVLQAEGAAPIHKSWLASAHPLGTKLEIRSGEFTMSGSFAGLSESGALLLRQGKNVQKINTGEIMLGTGLIGAEACC